MAGKNGGARPGAGRKRKETVEEQASRRDIVLDVVSPAAWRSHVESLLEQSNRGNYAAMLPLYPYILGSPKQEHDVKVTGGVTIYLPDRKAE